MRNKRDFVPRLCISTCSRLTSFAYLTCSRLIKLRSAYILCYFIRNRRYALVVSFVFLNAEYRIALVDFIVALRRTKGRRRWTLRSPSPPWNHACVVHWTPPPHPGVSAAAGHICCRGGQGYRQLVSGAVAYPQFRIWFGYLCSGLDRSRFSRVVGLGSFVFHYWGDRSFVPAATWGWAIIFRWICADREWVGNMADEG